MNKSGHSGTLDPKVTGVLPVALGRATRIVQTLLTAGKEYVAVMHVHKDVDEKALKDACEKFTGKIRQLPPIKCSIKREWRFRKVYYIDIMEINGKDVLMKIGCQAGTYIRKLCHDLGQELGVGAHMAELRRTKAGCFGEDSLVIMQDLKDAFHYYKQGNDKFIKHLIKPIEFAVGNLANIWVTDSAVESICHGANLAIPGVSKLHSEMQPDEKVAIMTLKDELIAVGTVKMTSKEIMSNDKGIAVITEKVFMLPGTYPRIQKV